jgi:aerobic carbon-monoxide dehydrogenase large subunit
MHTPNKATPAGIKGMAEGGVMGSIGALTNAVNDALAPFGVVAVQQPLTPMYLRGLLRDRQASADIPGPARLARPATIEDEA